MAVTTYEGIVKEGKIRLKSNVKLPENQKVYVVVPEESIVKKKTAQIRTPRLVQRKQASDFKMKVSKE